MKIAQKNRKIGYTYNSVSGRFSFRGEKTIAFESTLERDLLTLLEFDESVSDVIEQPITLEYVNKKGNSTTYTPDFLVHYRTISSDYSAYEHPSRLIEIKPKYILKKKWSELKPKFKVATNYARQQGYIFNIYDESRLHTQLLLNIKFLGRYKRFNYLQDESNRIITILGSMGHTQIDHLLLSLSPSMEERGLILGHIWNLLSNKVIGCNMQAPLNNETIIWLNTTDNEGLL